MMRTLFVVALLALQATQQPEPYEGQRDHREPPQGWECRNQSYELDVPQDHVCTCERLKKEDGTIVEDPKCKSWCHPSHCSCSMGDMTLDHQPKEK